MHVDGSCYRVCCMSCVAKDDALSNKRWKDSLQFFTNITHCINQKSSWNMSFHQITSNCLECNLDKSRIYPSTNWVTTSTIKNHLNNYYFKILINYVNLFMCNQNVHLFCPEFLAICQESYHSASDAMSKCLLARSTWLHKMPQTTLFLVETMLILVTQHIKFWLIYNWQSQLWFYNVFFILLEPLIIHVVLPRIDMKFRITRTFW